MGDGNSFAPTLGPVVNCPGHPGRGWQEAEEIFKENSFILREVDIVGGREGALSLKVLGFGLCLSEELFAVADACMRIRMFSATASVTQVTDVRPVAAHVP